MEPKTLVKDFKLLSSGQYIIEKDRSEEKKK